MGLKEPVRLGFDGKGARLELSPAPQEGAEAYVLELRAESHTGRVVVYDLPHDGLAGFFEALSREWSTARTWRSLEGEASIRSSADRLGHVVLTVSIGRELDGPRWRLTSDVCLEAGQLQAIARQVRAFFAPI